MNAVHSTPICTIILVNTNGGAWITRCLDSIEHHTSPREAGVIVVDNASTDGSREAISSRSNKLPVHLVRNKINVGFGQANNQGARMADTEYVLFLNSDCEFTESTIAPLADFLGRKADVGILFCKLLNSDGTLQPSVNASLPRPSALLSEITGWSTLKHAIMKSPSAKRVWLRQTLSAHDVPHEVAWGGGNFMFMRRADFDTVGGFDDAFFLYYEDADLCLRMRKSGKLLYYVPSPRVIHHWAKSTPPAGVNPTLENYRSRLHFVAKHHGGAWARIVRRFTLLEIRERIWALRLAGLFSSSADLDRQLTRYSSAAVALVQTPSPR